MGISEDAQRHYIDRIVELGGGHVRRDHVECVFAVLRTFASPARSPMLATEELGAANRFLVGSGGDDVVVMALQQRFTRGDALNLITWMTLVGGYSAEELEAARTAALWL